jgi:cell division protein FtsQ
MQRHRQQAAWRESTPPDFHHQFTGLWHTQLKWLKNLLWIAGALFTVGMGLLWILHPHTFPVKTIRIEGNIHTTHQELEHVIAPYVTDNFLLLDIQAIHAAVSTLPWVKSVSVRRSWLDTLSIELQEHQAVALWQNNAIVDSDGNIRQLPHLPTNLVHFAGDKDSVQILLTRYYTLKPLLEAAGLSVYEFGCNARQAWYLVLNNGIKLFLGRNESETRLQRFIRIYQMKNSPLRTSLSLHAVTGDKPLAYIDLRYTNGMAVRWDKAE